MKNYPRPNGQLQGDSKAMPDRGTRTGVTDTYGADVSQSATNKHGGMGSATKSDAAMKNVPCKAEKC